jgi:hypothetical protein
MIYIVSNLYRWPGIFVVIALSIAAAAYLNGWIGFGASFSYALLSYFLKCPRCGLSTMAGYRKVGSWLPREYPSM